MHKGKTWGLKVLGVKTVSPEIQGGDPLKPRWVFQLGALSSNGLNEELTITEFFSFHFLHFLSFLFVQVSFDP